MLKGQIEFWILIIGQGFSNYFEVSTFVYVYIFDNVCMLDFKRHQQRMLCVGLWVDLVTRVKNINLDQRILQDSFALKVGQLNNIGMSWSFFLHLLRSSLRMLRLFNLVVVSMCCYVEICLQWNYSKSMYKSFQNIYFFITILLWCCWAYFYEMLVFFLQGWLLVPRI